MLTKPSFFVRWLLCRGVYVPVDVLGDLILTLNGEFLHSSALTTAVVWGQCDSLDATAGTHAAAQDVVWVKVITTLRTGKGQPENNANLNAL